MRRISAIHKDDELPALLSSPNFVNFTAFDKIGSNATVLSYRCLS